MNEFTWAFHEIVVTYGIPSYKEINPTVFNMVTFPFLFGIMFGDIGHGGLLFLFAIYLCVRAPQLVGTSLAPFLSIRYMLLLMGFFATYCGFIYNDLMSLPLDLFGTCYSNRAPHSNEAASSIQVDLKPDCVYPFGFDPKWYVGHNELAYFNSFKMKLAVILGVMQMSLGVCMKGLNAVYHRSKLDFLFEFVPQIIFLLGLFGTMDVLILSKWLTDWTGREHLAPSIITQMINNVLKQGEIHLTPLLGTETQQVYLVNMLLLTCLVCVPTMLFVKPWVINKQHEEAKKASKE
jgi:V-type H+-transporting ATPase subunit a